MIEMTRIDPSESVGSGALVSTATDVATFLEAVIVGEFLPASIRDQMFQRIPTGPGRGYGLGVVGIDLADGRIAWGHGGGVPGFMSFAYATQEGEVVVALRNSYAEWSNISRWNALADEWLGQRTFID